MFAVISSTNLFLKRYPTPEAALNHYSIKDENIIKILDDNDCAVAYYKDGTVFKSDYLNKNDNGWGVISRKMWFPKVEKQIDEYLFLYVGGDSAAARHRSVTPVFMEQEIIAHAGESFGG